MHTIRVITRLAQNACRTDSASASSRLYLIFVSALLQLRLDYALASITCGRFCSSRNNPHYAPRHIIYYYVPLFDFVTYFYCFILYRVGEIVLRKLNSHRFCQFRKSFRMESFVDFLLCVVIVFTTWPCFNIYS